MTASSASTLVEPDAVYREAARAGLPSHEASVVATAIAWAESGLDPDAAGDEDLADEVWGPSMGLWQIRSLRVHAGTGRERDALRLREPAFNARAMVAISRGGTDWTPWTIWRNGRYRDFLAGVRAAVGEPGMTPVTIIRAAAADLEDHGYTVNFEPGWETRSTGTAPALAPQGLVCHHTATSRKAAGDYPSRVLVRDGRSDLAGPLAQFGLGRSGAIYVIAAGKANHAGGGGWNGLSGNYTVWGIEAENDGIGEPWPAEQVDAYLALAAALARFTGFGPEMVCRHAEWSDGGKIDTATAPLNSGAWIRAQVAERLAGPVPPTPPPPDPEEDDMASPYTLFNWGGAVWAWSGGDPLPLDNWGQVEPYLNQGAVTIGDLTDRQFEAIAPTWTGQHPAAAKDQARAMAAVRPQEALGCAAEGD